MQSDIVLFGIQGAGKGTQATLLKKSFPEIFSYFSSGDLFRTLTSSKNPIGDYLNARLQRGDLINDNVMLSLFETYLHTVVHEKKFMLLDGFPRTKEQFDALRRLFVKQKRKVVGFHFVLGRESVMARTLARGRDDDTVEAINHRIDQFVLKTQPVIETFSQHYTLHEIDADQSIANVHNNVLRMISR